MSASHDDAESVDAFLKRIASLKDKNDEEEARPRRRLEDEILQGRSERQARRAERTKSLSPVKRAQSYRSTPSLSPSRYRESNPEYASKFSLPESPSNKYAAAERSPDLPVMKSAIQDEMPTFPSPPSTSSSSAPIPNATALSRSGTLSWQQRPPPKDSNMPRRRPLSRYNDPTSAKVPTDVNEKRSTDQSIPTLTSEGQSRSTKLAEAGASPPTYKTNGEIPYTDIQRKSRPLPNIPQDPTRATGRADSPSHEREVSRSPAQPSPTPAATGWSDRLSGVSNQSTFSDSKSPFPTQISQRFAQPVEARDTDQRGMQRATISIGRSESLRDRPASPTKGLGGFVQSAMMKRSDSVNKRWSAQAASGLTRGTSRVGHRGSHEKPASITSGPESPPRESNRSPQGPSSPSVASRPTSGHGVARSLHLTDSTSHQSLPLSLSDDTITPAYQSDSAKGHQHDPKEADIRPRSPTLQYPSSPTKTMDPRRWSPTKASWLESALSKPEFSKVASSKPQTPGWMADLQKSKSSSDDADATQKSKSKFPIPSSTTGLVRSPPMAAELPKDPNASPIKTASTDISPQFTVKETKPTLPSLSTDQDQATQEPPLTQKSSEPKSQMRTTLTGSPSPFTSPTAKKQTSSPKPEPLTPPKTDFRANLRPRQVRSDEGSSAEPEFKNAFAKLKRTETKHYIAPDELKDNILRGKAALNLTGGPQKTPRVDEFKESILRKKEAMKAGAGASQHRVAGIDLSPTVPQDSKGLPEALARRSALNKHEGSPTGAKLPNKLDSSPGIPAAVSSMDRTPGIPSAGGNLASTDKPQPAMAANQDSVGVLASRLVGQTSANPEGKGLQGTKEGDSIPVSHGSNRAFIPVELAPKTPPMAIGERNFVQARGTLSSRVHPNLANVVLSGQAPLEDRKANTGSDTSPVHNNQLPPGLGEPGSSVGEGLTHMTKARAKGPKRRLPRTADEIRGVQDPSFKSRPDTV